VQIINFSAISSVDSSISDVNREYAQKMITNVAAKNRLISSLTDINNFQTKYGQAVSVEKTLQANALAQCLKNKSQVWCNQKIGNLFNIIQYQLNLINKALIQLKYSLLQTQLNLFYSLKWINQAGYNIINGDIKYLIGKL
jgi:hypothetical protein